MGRQDEQAFKDELKDAFFEEFDGIVDDIYEPVEGYEPPQYWQDQISELADRAVPIFTEEMYTLWLGLGRPEDEDRLAGSTGDVDKIVAAAIYQYASAYLWELANEYGLE